MTVTTTEFFTDWLAADGTNKNWGYDFVIKTSDSIIVEVKQGLDGDITQYTSGFLWSPIDDESGFVVYPSEGSALALGYYVRIVRNVPHVQPIEIGNEGPFHPELHETAFDSLTMQVQQVANAADRAVKVPLGSPLDTDELTQYLTAVGQNIDDVVTVADNITDITVVRGALTDINTVSVNIANVNAAGQNTANINAVVANATNINTVASNAAGITTVASNISSVNTVAANAAYVVTVAGSIGDVTTVANNIGDVNTAASNMAAIQAAPGAASAAANSAALAQDWATKAEDSPVSGGLYSAFHWAQKAANLVLAGLAGMINGAPTKAAPAAGDRFPLTDSADGYAVKKVSWASIKAALEERFNDAGIARPMAALVTTDWNDVKISGWYMGLDAANAPAPTGWFIGEVIPHNSLYVTQTVIGFAGASSTDTRTYRRHCFGGVWGAWYKLSLAQDEQDARYLRLAGGTMAPGGVLAFPNEEGPKILLWGTNYGIGIKGAEFTTWFGGAYRWRDSDYDGAVVAELTTAGLKLGAGAATPTDPLHAASKQYVDANAGGVGVGQTWQNVSGSRNINTAYQNTTGRPIQLSITFTTNSLVADFKVSATGSGWLNALKIGSTSTGHIALVIPNGWYYKIEGSGGITYWLELR